MAEAYKKDSSQQIAEQAVKNNGIHASSEREHVVVTENNFVFSVDVEIEAVANQRQSGRSSMFSALNFLRFHMEKSLKLPKGSFQLSQNNNFFYDKLEKSNFFMVQIVKYAGDGLDDAGVDLVQDQPVRWKIENSWGATADGKPVGHNGYFIADDPWFDQYVFEVAISDKYLAVGQVELLLHVPAQDVKDAEFPAAAGLAVVGDGLDDRRIDFLQAQPQQDGGDWDPICALGEKYGVVPQSSLPDPAPSKNTAERNAVLNKLLRQDAQQLRDAGEAKVLPYWNAFTPVPLAE